MKEMPENTKIGVLGCFILAVLTNHVTKCTDVLMYDLSLIALIVCFVIVYVYALSAPAQSPHVRNVGA